MQTPVALDSTAPARQDEMPPGDPDITQALLSRLTNSIGQVVRGKEEIIELALTAVLARGHILLEDVPGVGKTTLARAIARALGCSFKRIQFTSDLLPSDILGVNIYAQGAAHFDFRPGPIFAHVVLADEINRTTPKTQSSMLEAMNERQVSIDNDTYPLPDPFIVIATQNPQEYHGTYPLPESQLDRFMVRLQLGYPARQVEWEILRTRRGVEPVCELEPQLALDEIRVLQARVETVRVDDLVLEYLMQIVTETRRNPQFELGVSTRGALALQHAARARALLSGRDFTLPDDIKALAVPVLAHRVVTAGAADRWLRSGEENERAILDVLDQVPVPI